jgi:hypothetical protein
MNDQFIERCDTCNLFATDLDAMAAVEWLLNILDREHAHGGTVADALAFIEVAANGARR